MKVLGIETSTLLVGVALLDGERLAAEYRSEITRSRSERLMHMVDRILQDGQYPSEALSGIAVSIGPGSYTGLRIGLSTAKGLSFALGLPVVGVSSLEALAAPLAWSRAPFPICSLLDAKRREVYAALFQQEAGIVHRIIPEGVFSPQVLIQRLQDYGGPIIFVGQGIEVCIDLIRECLGERAVIDEHLDPYPAPAVVARLGTERLRQNRDERLSLIPLYLRKLGAEINLEKKSGLPTN